MHHNEVSGTVHGTVVQARDIHLHLGGDHQRLVAALHAATVRLNSGLGVAVSPSQVLTSGPDGLVLLTHEHPAYACLHPDSRPGDPLVLATLEPGAPVLNCRTGAVCAVLGPDGEMRAVPDLPPQLTNHAWLDLLTPEQLRAAGWRHLSPDLRRYLRDLDHPYLALREAAPPLSAIYLNRRLSRPDGHTPLRINAEELLSTHPSAQILGDPGVGKSSLIRRISAVTARAWLEGDTPAFLPLPITAEDLTRPAGLPDLLADGVVGGVPLSLERTQLTALFRAEAVPDVPWLVLVDGLDEVLDPRARMVTLATVARHRDNPAYRFLVTTRPLGRSGWHDRVDENRTVLGVAVLQAGPRSAPAGLGAASAGRGLGPTWPSWLPRIR